MRVTNIFLSVLFLVLSCTTQGTPTDAQRVSRIVSEENQGRWIMLSHEGESLVAFVPDGFEENAAAEDTVLLSTGVRQLGVGHFYTSSNVLLYVGAFALPEDVQAVSAADLVIFENALRDGAKVSHVSTTHLGDRFFLRFPNGDELVADVLIIQKKSIMFIAKSIRGRDNVDWPKLELFIRSLK